MTNSSYKVFLTASFSTTLLSLLKTAGIVSNLPISYLLISDFKEAKSTFLAKSDESTLVLFLKQILLHNWTNVIPILFYFY